MTLVFCSRNSFSLFRLEFRCHPSLGELIVSALDVTFSPEETIELKRRVRSATLPQREGRRARIILLAAEGETRDNIARLMGFSCPTTS